MNASGNPAEPATGPQSRGHHRQALSITFAALLLSGTAGVLNQVIWQRALKIFLGGSETISAMIVVLVFMLGLGLGAGLAAQRAGRLKHPLRAFGFVELALFAVNLLIALVLAMDLAESIYAAQRLALSLGIPLRVVYAAASLLILLVPTVLMGATLPLASEACQRQFGATDRLLIPVLFAVNTLGAVIGAGLSSFYLLPFFGQLTALVCAACLNLAAALVLIAQARRVAEAPATPEEHREASPKRVTVEEVFGLLLGFLSLGFEMLLFRLVLLLHFPLPYTFATTLCYFLLFWSVGVFIAGWFSRFTGWVFAATALSVAWTPALFAWDRYELDLPLWTAAMYFIPCIGFGILYGLLVARSANRWGKDVGRFYAMNTIGSCLGILFFTLVGYELPQNANILLIAASITGLGVVVRWSSDGTRLVRRRASAIVCITLTLLFAIVVHDGFHTPHTRRGDVLAFWGRDGVVEVDRIKGDVKIDGMWHSRLSGGKSHIGRAYTWMMAAAGVLACEQDPQDALVVGNCIGITAGTLAGIDDISIDAYEIVRTLEMVLKTFPDATLNVETDPQVNIIWTDGRGGLALNEKKYDLIISAPQQLRQAGGSMLLSREYLRLARARLKPGGKLVIYSYEGVPAQYELIRRTIDAEFPYTASWIRGLLTVASDSPIDFSRETIERRLQRPGAFYDEIRSYHERRRDLVGQGMEGLVDQPLDLATPEDGYFITDDHPLVEYPSVAEMLVEVPPALRERARRRRSAAGR